MALSNVLGMARHKYRINGDIGGAFAKTVTADQFILKDGYFRFFEGFSNNAEEVYVIDQGRVFTIERES